MLLCLLSADNLAFGRVDLFSLSDQDRMELLASGFHEKDQLALQREDGRGYMDVRHWGGITCDDDGTVTGIDWWSGYSGPLHEGSFQTKYLPANLKSIWISQCLLEGSFDAAVLPHTLKNLKLFYRTKFTGSFAFDALPEDLMHLDIVFAGFSGSMHLQKLPKGLRYLIAKSCSFSGAVRLDALPSQLREVFGVRNNNAAAAALRNSTQLCVASGRSSRREAQEEAPACAGVAAAASAW